MVVTRRVGIRAILSATTAIVSATTAFLLATAVASAQESRVNAWLDSTMQTVDEPFLLYVKAEGVSIETPRLPEVDGLIIHPSPVKQHRSFALAGGTRREALELGYMTTAIRPGIFTIPGIEIVVGGTPMLTEPLVLTVQDGAPQISATPETKQKGIVQAQAWVEETTVNVGQPFWLYLEATGRTVKLPRQFQVEGLRIDFKNSQRQRSSVGGFLRREKHGMLCTALRAGTITIPPIQVLLDNKPVFTKSVKLTAVEGAGASQSATVASQSPRVHSNDPAAPLVKELVFIEMDTDKREVYQGESVLLSQRLWRIIYGRVESGSYRGAVIVPPTTEGFYETFLDPVTYEKRRGAWRYEVSEERKVLYPTAIGALRIGQWHWEGVAIVSRRNTRNRNKHYFKENAGPIDIAVKPLPRRPAGFSGAVGHFTVDASLSGDSVMQGAPVMLSVTVTGESNPNAIGEPQIPVMAWAYVSGPERFTETYITADALVPTVSKRFVYTLTPLEDGTMTIPEIKFIYFDPKDAIYRTDTAGPFEVSVRRSTESQRRLLVPDGMAERGVEILGEDIRPIIPRLAPLKVATSSRASLPALFLLPVAAYAAFAGYRIRQRRFEHDTAYARAYHARSKALARLGEATSVAEPADEIFHVLVTFVADTFNVDAQGMTSEDVSRLLTERGIDAELCANAVKILRACERARYASKDFSADEMAALEHGAEACVVRLDEAAAQTRPPKEKGQSWA